MNGRDYEFNNGVDKRRNKGDKEDILPPSPSFEEAKSRVKTRKTWEGKVL